MWTTSGWNCSPNILRVALLDGGVGGVLRDGDRLEAGGQFRQPVAMRVPDLQRLGQPGEQRAEAVFDAQRAFAVFTLLSRLDFAAQILRQQLHPVADAEHGEAEFEERAIGQRRRLGIHARRAARQDDALGFERRDLRGGNVVAQDDRIDVALADAPRNDLRVLRAKIQDDDLLRRVARRAGSSYCLTTLTFPAVAS